MIREKFCWAVRGERYDDWNVVAKLIQAGQAAEILVVPFDEEPVFAGEPAKDDHDLGGKDYQGPAVDVFGPPGGEVKFQQPTGGNETRIENRSSHHQSFDVDDGWDFPVGGGLEELDA